jgi:hypothetical protein
MAILYQYGKQVLNRKFGRQFEDDEVIQGIGRSGYPL